uniref:Uncharacterized protein n=1 Tax=Globisporangium ultimum (strain ATCC 200006 / CBS 805.95 / DAOM BR144) TaxID=431595 RepID=K3X8N7_GLOUD
MPQPEEPEDDGKEEGDEEDGKENGDDEEEDEEEGDEEEDEDEDDGNDEPATASKGKAGAQNRRASARIAVASPSPPKFVPKPPRPIDHDGRTILQQKRIGVAWENGPRIDLEHFSYVQKDYARRQDAVDHLRERMIDKSRPGYQLRVQRKWTCLTFSKMLVRRHFSWMPCVIATMADAVWDGDILQVHGMLIQRGDVNARDPRGQLVLNIAIQQQYEPITRLLLDRGADFNRQDRETLRTPLIYSIIMGNKALTRRLLTRGADVNIVDGDGLSPLAWATMRGYLEIVAQLIELGADINHQDIEGWTPLHIACFKGYTELVEYLLVSGNAALEREDINGFSPFLFARIAENADIVKKLDNFVADVARGKRNKWQKKQARKKKKKTSMELSKISPKKLFVTAKN